VAVSDYTKYAQERSETLEKVTEQDLQDIVFDLHVLMIPRIVGHQRIAEKYRAKASASNHINEAFAKFFIQEHIVDVHVKHLFDFFNEHDGYYQKARADPSRVTEWGKLFLDGIKLETQAFESASKLVTVEMC